MHGEIRERQELDPALVNYLSKPGPHCLEIGAGWNSRPGWLATDLAPPPGYSCMRLDATKSFEIPSESFDFVYSEHMIEHITFEDGRNMLEECNRILKPFGVIRIVTPSIGFLSRVLSSDRGILEDRYRNWSVTNWVCEAPKVTNAFFLNNFVRAWEHKFIYDRETLELALQLSGFEPIVSCELNNSCHPLLCGLANVRKIPPGFLDLESMVLEGTKARTLVVPAPKGRNIAFGKRATQSSISPWSLEATPEAEAARVVSGHFTGSYNCHTGLDSPRGGASIWMKSGRSAKYGSTIASAPIQAFSPARAGWKFKFPMMTRRGRQCFAKTQTPCCEDLRGQALSFGFLKGR